MSLAKPRRDTPPVDITERKGLKRTLSTTSAGSLPTPPRTRKRKRSGSRHSRATDTDESDSGVPLGYDSDEDEIREREMKRRSEERGSLPVGRKKRKILRVDAIAAELAGRTAEEVEDEFWGVPTIKKAEPTKDAESKADSSSKAKTKTRSEKEDSTRASPRSRSVTRSPSCSPPPHLLKRNPTGLLSPPQSHRRKSPRVRPFPIPAKVAEPSTPPRKTRSGGSGVRRALFPERDSPENPFLDDVKSSDGSRSARDSSSPELESPSPETPATYKERRMLTYVLYV